MYKIRRGCPILGHKDRTHPPKLPHQGSPSWGCPGPAPTARGRPCSLPASRGGQGRLELRPYEDEAEQTGPPWPPQHPGSSSLIPMLLPPPHPHHSPTADSRTHLNTTGTGREGAALLEVGALEDSALLPWLFHRGRAEHSPNGLIEHCLQAPLGQG